MTKFVPHAATKLIACPGKMTFDESLWSTVWAGSASSTTWPSWTRSPFTLPHSLCSYIGSFGPKWAEGPLPDPEEPPYVPTEYCLPVALSLSLAHSLSRAVSVSISLRWALYDPPRPACPLPVSQGMLSVQGYLAHKELSPP